MNIDSQCSKSFLHRHRNRAKILIQPRDCEVITGMIHIAETFTEFRPFEGPMLRLPSLA